MPKTSAATRSKKETSSHYFPDGYEPTWEIAYLFPAQGAWTEEDYWNLEGIYEGSPRVELANGHLDVLPMPTELHQFILFYFAKLLDAFAEAHAPGIVLTSGMRVRVKKRALRDPDVVYLRAERAHLRHKKSWKGADLIVEIVSPDPKDTKRDWVTKRSEYALAGIPEYWIIDPQKQVICVLKLKGKTYRIHGNFKPGENATSALLPGFSVSVDKVLAPPGSESLE